SSSAAALAALHSVPTRRSSDLIDGKRVGMVMRVDIPGSGEVGAMVAQCAPAILRQAPTSVLVIGYESAVGDAAGAVAAFGECLRSEEHTSELQSRFDLVCRLLL